MRRDFNSLDCPGDGPSRKFTAEEEVQGYHRLEDPLEREITNLDSRNAVSAKGIKMWMLLQLPSVSTEPVVAEIHLTK